MFGSKSKEAEAMTPEQEIEFHLSQADHWLKQSKSVGRLEQKIREASMASAHASLAVAGILLTRMPER
jgi:hypothetical protein